MTSPKSVSTADVLCTAHLKDGLGTRAANGAFIAMGGQALRTGLGFACTIILARLLTPEDFGLVAMAATITSFCCLFVDLGLSTATVQHKEIDQNTASALFFINLGAGLLVTLAAVAAAPLAARWYGDQRMQAVAIGLALPIVLSAAAVQHRALLQRGMRWPALQHIDLSAQLAGGALAIALAWGTALGYWALIAQAWVTAAVTLILTWRACPWRPSRVTHWKGVRGALDLGLNLTGFNLVNYFHRQLDNVLIGWRWGPMELGYYTRAYSLLLLPLSLINGPTSSAIIPALSRLQHEPDRWRASYLVSLSGVVLVSAPLTALLIAAATPLVAILFGPSWSESANIFQYLAISMFAATPLNTTGWIYVSIGRTERMFRWSLVATPVIVLAFIVGLPFGAASLALAYSGAMWLVFLPGLAFAAYGTPIRLSDMLRVIAPLTGAGIVSALAGLAAAAATPASSTVISLLAISAATAGVYALLAGSLVMWAPVYAPLRVRVTAWLAAVTARPQLAG